MSVRGVRWSFRESARRPNPASETSGGGGPPSDARPAEDSFRWSYRGERWHLENNEGGEVSLLSAKLELVPLKDFSTEVRAFMDVNQFMNDATVLLDVTENTLESIVDVVLKKMLTVNEPSTSIVETSRATFMSDRLHMPTRTIQGVCTYDNGDFDYDHSWMCIMCSMPTLLKKRVAVVRLKHPANMGRTCEDVRFLVLVLTPTKEKGTKNAVETGRTFATLFADGEFRRRLWEARSTADFVDELMAHARALSSDQRKALALNGNLPHDKVVDDKKGHTCTIGQGLREDVRRRWSYYISDYVDGVVGPKTLYKTISTTFFLYFGILLPIIAFGVLNATNTHGKIDVTKCLMSQTIGGLFFAFLGGQPLVILMTTAPLSLYIKVIHDICEDFGFDFMAMYACVGLFNSLFLFLYVIFDVSKIMKWCTRSTEEIFSLFITVAFSVDAGRDVYKEFRLHYMAPECADPSVVVAGSIPSTYNLSSNASTALTDAALGFAPCQRDSSLLFLLLMVGTVWLGVSLYNFNKTPYLQAYLRDLLADYALPVAVVVLSFVGSFVFSDVPAEQFQFVDDFSLKRARVEVLPVYGILGALGLGFALSLLFFMDQNISAAMVNNPSNKLHKGTAYHLDLLVVGLLNAGLSLFGLPWMHGVLPHSPLHARSLADLEERVDQGHVQEVVVRSRETRLTGILSHVLIGLSLLMLPYPLSYIPTAVLDGLFLYMAVTSLIGNQMFERITLLFMEQAAYPPNHYIRRCPQRKIHTFTACQLVQLAVLCFFGFAPWPYVQMVFPVIILLLLPIRHKIITHFVDAKYLASLDGKHQ